MHSERRNGGSLQTTLLFGISAILIALCIVYAPSEAFQASRQGLAIWWRIVFPALLPFLVLSEILLASGFAHGAGVLLEPLTRKYLGLPGPFAWVLPLGLTAGFPASAQAAATLHKQGKISSKEAERMAGAAHFASPMLLVVVIGAGFLGREELGLLLLAIHWISGLATGVTMHLLHTSPRSRGQRREAPDSDSPPNQTIRQSRLRKAASHMEEARRADGRGFGKLLGDAVSSAVQTLMTTGGYMLIFAVFIHVIASFLPGWIPSFGLSGLLEVHLGTYAAAKIQAPSPILCALLGAILGWSGICAYLQVRSLLKPAGIGTRTFLLYRILHGAYAYVFTLLLWRPLSLWLPDILPASAGITRSAPYPDHAASLPDWKVIAEVVQSQFWLLLLLCTAILGLSLIKSARKSG